MPKLKFKTELTLPVEITFDILPALESEGLPAQIDIISIKVTDDPDKTKRRSRRTELLPHLRESDLLLLEDEILENWSIESS